MTEETKNLGPAPMKSADVARRYRVTLDTVSRWIREGKLNAFRPGGVGPWYVAVGDLVAFENPDASFLSPEEVAKRWVKDVETVRRWCRSGVLKSFKTPGAGRVLIPLAAVEQMERRQGGVG